MLAPWTSALVGLGAEALLSPALQVGRRLILYVVLHPFVHGCIVLFSTYLHSAFVSHSGCFALRASSSEPLFPGF